MHLKVCETIEKFKMFDDTKAIVVGVSGGADSVSLLHFLKQICSETSNKNELKDGGKGKENSKIRLIAAHVNHCLRQEESDRDEEFVRQLCKKWGIELFVKRENIANLAKQMGLGLEECGRKIRYDYFSELCEDESFKIATAHTLSDNIETIFLNLTRGCGLNGLCGIPPVRGKIVRPLIETSRDEVEKYCLENDIEFINDSTNFTCDYTRNKIRLKVIPQLKEINTSFDNVFRRFFTSIFEDSNYLNSVCNESFDELCDLDNLKYNNGFDVEKIKKLPNSIKRRVVLKILARFGVDSPEYKDTELMEKLLNGEINGFSLSKTHKIGIKNGRLNITLIEEKKKSCPFWEHKAKDINILTETKKTFIIGILKPKEFFKLSLDNENILKNSVNMDIINRENLFFRNRRPGDVFSPFGRGLTKKVKKLFNEIKIPLDLRDNLTMLTNGQDLIWIDGIGVSEKYRVKNDTKTIGVISERQDF